MSPWKALAADVDRYRRYSGQGVLRSVLVNQGLWALVQYRVAASVYQSRLPKVLKRPLLLGLLFWQKAVEMATGIRLPYSMVAGPGLYIGHFGNVILNASAVIGSQCNLSQGVTIGVSGRGEFRGVPTIGNRVYIGPNAVVSGRIYVGDGAVIGACSLVTRDVPPGCTVLGVPAVVVSERDSSAYLDPEGTA